MYIFPKGDKKHSFMLTYNSERRGVISKEFPEKKSQIIFAYTKRFDNLDIKLYFENDRLSNYNFVESSFFEQSNIFGFQIIYFIGEF